MNFSELRQEVFTITSRPDLVGMTNSAISAATLKAHHTDFYSKDIYETPIQFPKKDFRQSLDYILLIPNYRALKYARKYDTSSMTTGSFFTVLTPEEILDKWGKEKTDVAYVAGRVLEFKSSTEFDTFLLGCYVSPTILEASYSSWIAELYPYAIVHEAARRVFGQISMDAEKKSQAQLLAEEYSLLKMNALPDVGS